VHIIPLGGPIHLKPNVGLPHLWTWLELYIKNVSSSQIILSLFVCMIEIKYVMVPKNAQPRALLAAIST